MSIYVLARNNLSKTNRPSAKSLHHLDFCEIDPLRNLDLQTLQAVVPEMRERTFVYSHNANSAIGRLP